MIVYDNQIEKSYPYVVRATTNNGIRGYLTQDKEFLNEGETLSFAQDTFTVFIKKNHISQEIRLKY